MQQKDKGQRVIQMRKTRITARNEFGMSLERVRKKLG